MHRSHLSCRNMTRFGASLFHSQRRLGGCIIPNSCVLRCWQQQSIVARTTLEQSFENTIIHKTFSSKTNHSSNKKRNYDKPFETDEGVLVWQSDPTGNNNGSSTVQRNQLVWGSIMWPSGICLSKYLWYLFHRKTTTSSSTSNHTLLSDRTTILELGCGTGLVGLTAAKLGAKRVSLTDSATSDLRPILSKSAASNGLSFNRSDDSGNLELLHLDWKDVDTFVDIPTNGLHCDDANDDGNAKIEAYYDWIVAADVLYGGGDALFARALAAHLPSAEELGTSKLTMALVAVPNRSNSPLANFFRICSKLGLSIERLETNSGAAAGASHGQDPIEAFGETHFVPIIKIGNDTSNDNNVDNNPSIATTAQWEEIVKNPEFAPTNRDEIQLFRIQRVRGSAQDARSIRRVGRL